MCIVQLKYSNEFKYYSFDIPEEAKRFIGRIIRDKKVIDVFLIYPDNEILCLKNEGVIYGDN